jgi:hypothetical protein
MNDKQMPAEMPRTRNTMILAGWIAALILVAGVAWFLTQPLRSSLMLTAVNQVLAQAGDERRLQGPLASAVIDTNSPRIGFWYTMTDGARAFVFLFIADGTFFPALAVLTQSPLAPEAAPFALPPPMVQFVPLSNHGARALERVCYTVLEIYGRRILGGQL